MQIITEFTGTQSANSCVPCSSLFPPGVDGIILTPSSELALAKLSEKQEDFTRSMLTKYGSALYRYNIRIKIRMTEIGLFFFKIVGIYEFLSLVSFIFINGKANF